MMADFPVRPPCPPVGTHTIIQFKRSLYFLCWRIAVDPLFIDANFVCVCVWIFEFGPCFVMSFLFPII